MTIVTSETTTPNEFPQTVRVRAHAFAADVDAKTGSTDAAPGPHDYFDTALATCKSLTAIWYARRKGFPLERVDTHVESDATDERKGVYRLRVRVELHGPLSDEQRADIQRAILGCPIHKLMTTTDVQIETVTT